MNLEVDYSTGTGATPRKIPLDGNRFACVVIAYCKNEPLDAYKDALMFRVQDVLTALGCEPTTSSTVFNLPADKEFKSVVQYSANVARDLDSPLETTTETAAE